MKYKEAVFQAIKSRTSKSFDEMTSIRDLGLDSIDLIEMVVEFEEQFGITIPSEKINAIKTIRDLLTLLDGL